MDLDNSLVADVSAALNLELHKHGPLIYQGCRTFQKQVLKRQM